MVYFSIKSQYSSNEKMTFIQKFIQKKNKVIAGNSVNSAGKLGNSVYPELRPEGWSNYLYKSRG